MNTSANMAYGHRKICLCVIFVVVVCEGVLFGDYLYLALRKQFEPELGYEPRTSGSNFSLGI